jgi:hypothetical protein
MIKTITKIFAFVTILKNLLETKKGDITEQPKFIRVSIQVEQSLFEKKNILSESPISKVHVL